MNNYLGRLGSPVMLDVKRYLPSGNDLRKCPFSASRTSASLASTRETLELQAAFSRIESPFLRRMIITFVLPASSAARVSATAEATRMADEW
jgi:hypothetical protein